MERVSKLEGAYEQVNERLGSIERKVDTGFNALQAKMDNQFATLVRLIVAGVAIPVTAAALAIIFR